MYPATATQSIVCFSKRAHNCHTQQSLRVPLYFHRTFNALYTLYVFILSVYVIHHTVITLGMSFYPHINFNGTVTTCKILTT